MSKRPPEDPVAGPSNTKKNKENSDMGDNPGGTHTYNGPVFNQKGDLRGARVVQGVTVTYHEGSGPSASEERIQQLRDEELDQKTKTQVKDKFGTDDTVGLLLSGVGHSDQQNKDFKQNLKDVKQMLIDHFKIRFENIYTVEYTPGETKHELMKKFCEIKKKEKENFLFYYLGHNDNTENGLEIDDESITVINYISYEELKKCLTEIKASNKLFIIDTCFCGDVALKKEDKEELFPLLWDITLNGEEDVNKLQWRSSQKDEEAFFNPAEKIGFTSAIRQVLSHPTCTGSSCRSLKSDFPESFVPIKRLHECVCDHVSAQKKKQHPYLDFNQGNEKIHMFPLIAKLN